MASLAMLPDQKDPPPDSSFDLNILLPILGMGTVIIAAAIGLIALVIVLSK